MASSSRSGGVSLRGRFPAGTQVELVKVDGPHVLRTGPEHEVVDSQKVDKDGRVSFSKGVTVGDRYFARGRVRGDLVEVRLTGRDDPDDGFLTGYEPVTPDRARLGVGGSGGFADEELERGDGDEQTVEGQTWLAQDQVKRGTLQRSDTVRGSAHPISADERERAVVQWRKSEPTTLVVQPTSEAEEEEARTAELPDRSPARQSTSRKGK